MWLIQSSVNFSFEAILQLSFQVNYLLLGWCDSCR